MQNPSENTMVFFVETDIITKQNNSKVKVNQQNETLKMLLIKAEYKL